MIVKLGVVVIAPMPGWVGVPHLHVGGAGDKAKCERCGLDRIQPVHVSPEGLSAALERWEGDPS